MVVAVVVVVVDVVVVDVVAVVAAVELSSSLKKKFPSEVFLMMPCTARNSFRP